MKWSSTTSAILLGLTMAVAPALACVVDPDGAGIRVGQLPRSWQASGPDCPEHPAFQVHAYNDDLYILRESGCSNYEKPFLYLLFGQRRALLLDTGAGQTDVAQVVKGIVDAWLARHSRATIELVVAHTHAHGDHIAGDAQMQRLPHVTVVEPTLAAVTAFFGIRDWPTQLTTLDLGDRIIDVIPIPGHEATSIALYDRQTAILFTGDTLYPGRLYVRDAADYAASIRRLVDFTHDKVVAFVLGNHIEQTHTPYLDYPVGTVYQPDEHVLELGRAELLELNEALAEMQGTVTRRALKDFTIWPK